MKRKNDSHELVLQCISEALLKLMEKKPFKDINVSELCEKAGVSRVSFYRNFNSMPDILVHYLSTGMDAWWEDFIKRSGDDISETFWGELLTQYKKNERLILLIDKNDMSYIIKDQIFASCGPIESQSVEEQYVRAVIAGAIYGVVEQWIKTGMKEPSIPLSIHKLLRNAKGYCMTTDE